MLQKKVVPKVKGQLEQRLQIVIDLSAEDEEEWKKIFAR